MAVRAKHTQGSIYCLNTEHLNCDRRATNAVTRVQIAAVARKRCCSRPMLIGRKDGGSRDALPPLRGTVTMMPTGEGSEYSRLLENSNGPRSCFAPRAAFACSSFPTACACAHTYGFSGIAEPCCHLPRGGFDPPGKPAGPARRAAPID